jgi:hypothetical protein
MMRRRFVVDQAYDREALSSLCPPPQEETRGEMQRHVGGYAIYTVLKVDTYF